MKSICLDVRKLELGGIGTYLQNILKFISPSRFDISLLVPKKSIEKHPYLHAFRLIPFHVPDYSFMEQVRFPFAIPECDLFWIPHFNLPLFPIRAKKILMTLPDLFHLVYFSKLSFLEKRYAKFFLSQAVKRSDHLITVSNFSKRELLRFTQASNTQIEVIPNGVDQELFKPCLNPDRQSEVKKKYHLPSHYFLFIGNQKLHKNLRGALKAFAHFLSQGNEECYFVIAGSGKGLRHVDDLHTCFQLYPSLKKRVCMLGYVEKEDLPLIYQMAVSLVFPSFYEGFGLPPLEAMSVGCPAIVSRVASLEEVCGDAVYYIDPYDVDSITQGMKILWKNPSMREHWMRKGQQHAKTFLWKETAEKHMKLIEELLV